MSSTTTTNEAGSSSTSAEASSNNKPFPSKARVILHGLKADDFNGKVGIIQAGSINGEGRQQVFVEALDKSVALKLTNLKYQERPLESLSNKELKSILRHREVLLKFQGMDKTDLQAKLTELTSSPLEIAEWLAHANAPSFASEDSAPSSGGKGKSKGNNKGNNNMQAGMDNMNPDMLRQQAQMMRSMPPATVRSMNPQLAHMSDAQIQQAASQMEMMAGNPQMMQAAKKQMQNMSPAQKKEYEKMMGGAGGGAAPPPARAAPQNPQEMLANMSPEQLQQQATAMRSMPPATLRQMNPQMANMTDAQIEQAATQMEMMATNPELMKMANEQMKNLSPEQVQDMMKGGAGAAGNMNPMMMPGAAAGGAGQQNMTMDPAKMLETMDTKQIKNMMNMLKSNPEMLDQLAAQSGMPKEGLTKAMDMFGGMSDEQMESSLKTMAKFQKVSSIVQNAWKSVDNVAGGKLKIIMIIGMVCLFIVVILYFLGGGDSSAAASATEGIKSAAKKIQEDSTPLATPQESEF